MTKKRRIEEFTRRDIINLERRSKANDIEAIKELASIKGYEEPERVAFGDSFIVTDLNNYAKGDTPYEDGYPDDFGEMDPDWPEIEKIRNKKAGIKKERKPRKDAVERVALAIHLFEKKDVSTETNASKRVGTNKNTFNKYQNHPEVIELVKKMGNSRDIENRYRRKYIGR